jgi:2-dehydropantoate 2-reductase
VDAFSFPTVGILTVGKYPEGLDDRARTMAADLTAAGFLSPAEADVMRWKYGKLLSNLSNVIDAAAGRAARQSELYQRTKDEARAVLQAAGIAWATEEEDAARRDGSMTLQTVQAGRSHPGSSSWQSLARGTGNMETDYLNGEIVLLGRIHGVPTPLNSMLQRLAVDLVKNGTEPGSVPLEDLLAAAGS